MRSRWLVLLLAAFGGEATANTYFIRPDGGDATQCNGIADRAYAAGGAASSSAADCAWSHPFIALPPGGRPRIAGGDTVRIAPGSYRMGFGAPGAEHCARDWPWDCHVPPVPSGSAAQPTRIVGTDAGGRCIARPELWGTERASRVIDLDGSHDVELACLDITDHAACAEHHCHGGDCGSETAACRRDAFPYGDWAGTGIHARDAARVTLRDVDIHGMAVRGIHAGRLRDWTVQRVRIVANGWSGWDGDLGEDSANAGLLRFEQVEIAWNGCIEPVPRGAPVGCWAQQNGGYGDGLGTAATAGNWQFIDVDVHHNTSDGIDLLYLRLPGTATLERARVHGNAGNQVKLAGAAKIADSTIAGDCAAFAGSRTMQRGDHCRALGNAVVVVPAAGAAVVLERNRISGRGDCLVVAERGGADSRVSLRGNRLYGEPRWADAAQLSCGFYAYDSASDVVFERNAFIGVRNGQCPADSACE